MFIHTSLDIDTLRDFVIGEESTRAFSPTVDTIIYKPVDSFSADVEMKYRYLTFTGYSKFRKTFVPPDTVRLELMEFESNWSALPTPQITEITYSVHKNDIGTVLFYSQQVTLNRNINALQLILLKWNLNFFRKRVEHTIKEMELNVY
ncbi:hypothetical protein CHISP_0884 [Chitinispirillum alkaliphilum]|nr:hypothetical protein CHISP_0884 [Chitinispirillum alkaliphilum]